MARLLAEAFERIKQLPENEQDYYAHSLLAELEAGRAFEALLLSRPDVLDKLVAEAIAEDELGLTRPIEDSFPRK